MHDLHNNTAAIMEAVNTQNRPAVITRMGRFIALIQPLTNIENLEGKLIARAIESGDIKLVPANEPSASKGPVEIDLNRWMGVGGGVSSSQEMGYPK
jgi:hypothetical protein